VGLAFLLGSAIPIEKIPRFSNRHRQQQQKVLTISAPVYTPL
jgi:hypothetical protein